MATKKMNLTQFLAFKKQLKMELTACIKKCSSPVKGRTYVQLLADMVARDKLANDPEVEQLQVETVIKNLKEAYDRVKDWCDKKVTVWRLQVVKEPSWQQTVECLFSDKEKYEEALEECKQVVDVLKEVKLGLRKATLQQKRAVTYKVNKIIKAFQIGGHSESLARFLGRVVAEWHDTDKSPTETPAFDGSYERVGITKENAKCDIADLLTAFAETHKTALEQETLNLKKAMQGESIMKPLSLSRAAGGQIQSIELMYELVHDISKPWLLLGNTFANTWGPLRWPLPGIPCVVYCPSDSVLVVTIAIDIMLEKGVTFDIPDWFTASGEERKLSEEHLEVTLLHKAASMVIPFGHVAFFSPVVNKSAFDKLSMKDRPCGNLLVQWLFPKEVKASQSACAEVQHSITKHFAQSGTTKPWSAIHEEVKKWLDAIQPAPSA